MSPENPSQDPQAQTSPEELLRLISKPLDDVLSRHVNEEADYEKQSQYLRLRKCDFYIRGMPFLALDDSAGYLDWRSVSTPVSLSGSDGDDESGMLDYHIDIVDSFRKKYIATLGLRPFHNARAVPDDPQSEMDRKAARQANLCAAWMKAKWGIRLRNIELFDKQYSCGTVYIHNPFVADETLFGTVEVPQYRERTIETPQGPDPMGLPQPPLVETIPELVETKKFPASGPAFYLYDGYTVTVPFSCRDFRKLPWLLHECEENRGVLLQLYGKILRDRLNKDGDISYQGETAAQQEGQRTRAEAASLTGTYRPGSESNWTRARYYLATFMYEFVRDDDIRATLYEKFPKGICVHKVQGVTVKIANCSIASEWGHVPPFPGNTIYQDPVCWGILGNQDIIDFVMNIAVSKEERGLPSAIADAELIDTDALNKRRYRPKEVIPASPRFGGSLRDALIPLPTPNKDDGAADILLGRVMENTQTLLGLMPAVWGGTSQQETAAGQRMEISQGLMQLGVPGEMASQGYADAYMRGCLLIAEHAPAGFAVPAPDDDQGMTSEVLDIEALRAGKYHFEADPGMPMTRAELVDIVNGIIKENPDLAMAMGLNAPLAATAMREFILPGLPEIPSPLGDVRDKVVERIQELLQQQPMPGVPDPMTGEPGPMTPSILPTKVIDDPAQHLELTREWLNGRAGRAVARKANAGGDAKAMAGYQNVLAYALHCAEIAAPPPAPPAPPKPLSVSVKAPELLIPGVPEVLNASFGLGIPPAPEPPPMQQQMNGMPQQGPPPGPQQPDKPMGEPGGGELPPATTAPMIQ